MVLLPLGGLAVELLEQLGFLLTLLLFPNRSYALGWAVSTLSSAKLVLLAALSLSLVSLVCTHVAKRVRRPTRR